MAMQHGFLDWQIEMCDPDVYAEYLAFWKAQGRMNSEDAAEHKRKMNAMNVGRR